MPIYRVERIAPGPYEPCAEARDDTQPCSPESATYLVTREDGRTRRICSNHAARFCADHRLPFPIVENP